MKNNNGIFKVVFILIIFVLFFLVGYNFIKSDSNLDFLQANSSINNMYYCDDDSYILNNNMCFKYKVYSAYLLGDLDNNNIINIEDIEIVKEYIDNKKELSSIQIKIADVNMDNTVDINDVSMLQGNLKDNNTDIGKKYICDSDDEKKNDLCMSKYSKEAKIFDTIKGDINQNKILDNNDLYILYNYINNKGYLTDLQLNIADINNDGKVDNVDFKWFKSKKLKNIIIDDNILKINDIIYENNDIKFYGYKEKKNINKDFYKYYFDFNVTDKIYYKWELYSDDKKVSESECQIIHNNSRLGLNVEFNGIKNYGKIILYADEKCDNMITSYNTYTHSSKSIK